MLTESTAHGFIHTEKKEGDGKRDQWSDSIKPHPDSGPLSVPQEVRTWNDNLHEPPSRA